MSAVVATSTLSSGPANPIPTPIHTTRHARAQILISLFLGLFAFLTFALLRVRYPKIYIANFTRSNANYLHTGSRRKLPKLPSTLFGWIPVLYGISEEQVLDYAGLDAVVFLGFFKMCIKILAVCLTLALTVITPIRYKYTNRVDDDNDNDNDLSDLWTLKKKNDGWFHSDYPHYLWMYTIFTYVFTVIVCGFLFRQTVTIIRKRQEHLGKQNSITDRTVKLIGIPPLLRDDHALKKHIESLGVGEVDAVVIVKEWNELNRLFKLRKLILRLLEVKWVQYFELNNIGTSQFQGETLRPNLEEPIQLPRRPSDVTLDQSETDSRSIIEEITDHLQETEALPFLPQQDSFKRPQIRTGILGLFGSKVDAIDYYTQQLEVIDREIIRARLRDFPATSAAFLTMKSVAQAQLLAQAVLDPKVNHLITTLAPAPHDIIWDNLCLTRRERNTHIVLVMFAIGFLSIALIFPVSYLAAFLNLKSISKLWPSLGNLLEANPLLASVVTNMLPTYIFTIFNIVMPFLYVWITSKQGYTSHSDEELSLVSKNFFYIFVNLFLVFTMAGTVSLTTTTKFASQFAKSLKEVLLFYVDLIILQGLGIFPYKLLLLGNLLKFPLSHWFWCKTPRDYLNLCKPPNFNFGLQLPQPMLILIITIIYSILSTKILTAGLLYFLIGFFVYKYQLLYACVHTPHSTGKVWPLIFRRVIMGLLIFQLTMLGNLALQRAYMCASVLAPLPLLTMFCLWNFEKSYVPLSIFIALRSLKSNSLPHMYHDGDEETPPTIEDTDYQTLDERRELNKTYEYPNLVEKLEAPLIAIEGNDMLFVNGDGSLTRANVVDEWM